VRGYPIHSARSESVGRLVLVRFVYHYAKYHGLQDCESLISSYCDNMSVVKSENHYMQADWIPPSSAMRSDYDAFQMSIDTRKEWPVKMSLTHTRQRKPKQGQAERGTATSGPIELLGRLHSHYTWEHIGGATILSLAIRGDLSETRESMARKQRSRSTPMVYTKTANSRIHPRKTNMERRRAQRHSMADLRNFPREADPDGTSINEA
jgi:hypothetical protein